MASLVGLDPALSYKETVDGDKTGKRVAEDKESESPPISKKIRSSGSKGPRVHLFYPDNNRASEEATSKCIEAAISFLNEQSLSKQGPVYDLVDRISCMRAMFPRAYHCNFTARPKNGSVDEDKLFFAELDHGEDGKHNLTCRICHVIGPSGTKTGLYGCKICNSAPGHVQHPKGVGYRKEYTFPKEKKHSKSKTRLRS